MKISVRDKDNDLLKPLEIITLKGEDGITPNIQIGTVTTVDSEQEASVVKRGTKEEPIFDFNIPRGGNGNSNESAESSSICIDDTIISKDKTWSSSKIEDFVHTNDDVIWSTVQGKNLSVDYTKEGYLREIEIWGNTVQNEDNLSDIQHLGELYVDNEGREQYKIEIESYNGGSIQTISNYTSYENGYYYKKPANKLNGITILDKSLPNTKYTINFTMHKTYIGNQFCKIYEVKGDDVINEIDIMSATPSGNWEGTIKKTFITSNNSCKLILGINSGNGLDMKIKDNINLSLGDIIIPKNKSHKTTLLLPCQLMKVGDISDRLYWDKEKNKYVIEKNIFKSKFNSSIYQAALAVDNKPNWGIGLSYDTLSLKLKTVKPIFSRILSFTPREAAAQDLSGYIETVGGTVAETVVRIFVKGIYNREEAINTVDNLDMDWWYVAKTPQLIETNITKEIILPSYKDNTHLFVTGGIDGSIKAKAPIDGAKAISCLQEENIQLKETNIIQDELIDTTLLATDEILTILEPLLVDLLSDNSSSKIIDMYVAMVKRKRGLKTIVEVPLRYRERVKEMIEKEGEI